jgi:SAM-dependent methyltransferase
VEKSAVITAPVPEPFIWSAGRKIIKTFYDRRREEYAYAWSHLKDCQRIVDIACGTGTFMQYAPDRMEGVDINPDNIAYCRARGLQAREGDALTLPFPDNSFDGVHSSHVLQVFSPDQATRYVRELFRVCKPGGKVVIVTLNNFKNFWRHPENIRPYPPVAIYNMFARQRDEQSPMWSGMPAMPKILGLRLRRPPLIEFESTTSLALRRIASVLNALQYGFYLRKYWKYDAYTLIMGKNR